MEMVAVVPWLHEKYIGECLESIRAAGLPESSIFEGLDQGLGVGHNRVRLIQEAQEGLSGEDVICLVDGDDSVGRDAFEVIRQTYDKFTLMSYGGALSRPMGSQYLARDWDFLRHLPWRCHSMRTFRVALWRELEKRDPELACLKDDNGVYFRGSTDVALMFPIMEMSGPSRCKFVSKKMYNYRTWSGNTRFVDPQSQSIGRKVVGGRPRWDLYER